MIADHRSDRLLTPVLVVDARAVDRNIATMLAAVGGDPARWRPHVKTAKLEWTIGRLLAHGVSAFKCATTLELSTLAAAGATDVLYAMPLSIASAARLEEVASERPRMAISALTDSTEMLGRWPAGIGLTIDLDVGMHRTGIDVLDHDAVMAVATGALERGIRLDGLHAYDGHLAAVDRARRPAEIAAELDRIVALIERLRAADVPIPLVTTSGTPTFVETVRIGALAGAGVRHQVSPGTVVYFDLNSADALGAELPFEPAVHVLSRVISAPRRGWITCDAGHKAVSADAGVPTCAVVGRPDLVAEVPSEEHLPIRGDHESLPAVGELVALVPRHVCPTVNLYDSAILLDGDGPPRVVRVTARGREAVQMA